MKLKYHGKDKVAKKKSGSVCKNKGFNKINSIRVRKPKLYKKILDSPMVNNIRYLAQFHCPVLFHVNPHFFLLLFGIGFWSRTTENDNNNANIC